MMTPRNAREIITNVVRMRHNGVQPQPRNGLYPLVLTVDEFAAIFVDKTWPVSLPVPFVVPEFRRIADHLPTASWWSFEAFILGVEFFTDVNPATAIGEALRTA